MSGKRVKRLRKELGYDLKKERQEGRKIFTMQSKEEMGNIDFNSLCEGQKLTYEKAEWQILKVFSKKKIQLTRITNSKLVTKENPTMEYVFVTFKDILKENGTPKYLGIRCDQDRRLYQMMKKVI
jgi:hypothetical protein